MLPRHKFSPTSCLCRIYHSWKLLLHWIFFIRFYTICVYCSQTGAWHWPLCKKCTDKFSFEYFKFVSSLFWHSIIIIINIVFLFYFIFQCYYSFLGWYFLCLLSVHLNVRQYVFSCPVHLFHLCTLVYCVVFTEVLRKKNKKNKMFVKRGGRTCQGAQNDTKGVERKIKHVICWI